MRISFDRGAGPTALTILMLGFAWVAPPAAAGPLARNTMTTSPAGAQARIGNATSDNTESSAAASKPRAGRAVSHSASFFMASGFSGRIGSSSQNG